MKPTVLFLSISGTIEAVARGRVEEPSGMDELFFVNHTRRCASLENTELAVAAQGNTALLSRVIGAIRSASKRGNVSWARKGADGHAARRTWQQLNAFLHRAGLVQVDAAGPYISGHARDLITAANPHIRVFV